MLCAAAHRAFGHAWGTLTQVFYIFKDRVMHASLSLGPLVSLMAGILILIVPRLLNYIVAIYLIVAGLLGLFGDIHFR
jgi:hypothetical protein